MIVRKIGFTALGALALGLAAGSAQAAKVWVIDDGEKVGRDEISLPFREGRDNPIWQPGQPVRLFALQNETVSLQVIVQGEDEPLQGVTVDLRALDGPGGASIANDPGATDPGQFTGRWIERFVEHYFEITRHSATGYDPTLSLGWDSGSGPASDRYTGWIPDALIPVEIAPSWAPYPLQVPARRPPSSPPCRWISPSSVEFSLIFRSPPCSISGSSWRRRWARRMPRRPAST